MGEVLVGQWLRRVRPPVAILALALVALASFQAGMVVGASSRRSGVPASLAAAPPAGDHEPASGVARALRGVTAVSRPVTPQAEREHATLAPDLSAFRGLGAWIDLYDLGLDPESTVKAMKARGVQTLYLQTGRYNTRGAVTQARLVGRWLRWAHAVGMKVVGWYLPGYGPYLRRDVARTVAIARFHTYGHRFDALGVDIEWRGEVPNRSRWNRHVASHMRVVRSKLGPAYPIAAIPPPPLQMAVAPGYWRGFPWGVLGRTSDVIVPMAYWSARSGCPEEPKHCAYGFTYWNIKEIRRLTGDPRIPIHIIGGVGDGVTAKEVSAFVRAAIQAGAFGASMYDFLTTRAAFWAPLTRLARLGARA